MEEETNKLQASLDARASQQELFEKKVFVIGELHTKRALLANRVGRVKSESMIDSESENKEAKSNAFDLEKEMSEVSKSITDFKPESLEELESFRVKTIERMDAIEEKIAGVEDKLHG